MDIARAEGFEVLAIGYSGDDRAWTIIVRGNSREVRGIFSGGFGAL